MSLETWRRVPTACFALVLPLVSILALCTFHLLLLLLLLKSSRELTLLLVLVNLLLLSVRGRIKYVLFIRNWLASDRHILLVLLHHDHSTHWRIKRIINGLSELVDRKRRRLERESIHLALHSKCWVGLVRWIKWLLRKAVHHVSLLKDLLLGLLLHK